MQTPKTVLIFISAGAAIAVMAFVGVLAGNQYLDWRRTRALEKKVEGLQAGESTGLRAQDPFPQVALVDLEGDSTTTTVLTRNKESIILFVSTGCDACTEAVQSWSRSLDAVPEEIQVFGIADAELEYVRVYAQKTGFAFPVYCDEPDAFGSEHDMDVYPTVVGVGADGIMRFVRHGINESFTPGQAVNLLRGS